MGTDLTAADAIVHAEPHVYSVDLSDTWQPLRELTVIGALRRDEQHERDLTLGDEWEPRVGVVVDPAADGRSKLFAQFARTTELLPAQVFTNPYLPFPTPRSKRRSARA